MDEALQSPPSWYEGKKGLLVALGLSAGLKVSLALWAGDINPDGDEYIWAAQLIAAGDFRGALDLTSTPFFSLLIALVHVLIPDWVIAARMLTSASLVFATIPLYLLARDLFGSRAAFFGCLAFALAPYFNECALDVVRGPTYLFFFAWGVYFATTSIREKRVLLLVPALVSAWISVFLRPEGIVLVVVLPLFLLVLAVRKWEDRRYLFKGLSVWLVLPGCALFIILISTGSQSVALERFGEINQEVESFVNLEFLDNYHRIYEQLEEMEEASSYPGGKQNLAEIARHFMPGLYFYGLLRTLIDVLFPFFVIPLILGFRHRLERGRLFVLLLTICYVLLIFYRLVDRDFIQSRFLLVPAFLLFPWVGLGMKRILDFVRRPSRPWWPLVLCALVFLASPAGKTAELYGEQERVSKAAGKWLGTHPELKGIRVVSTDSRIVFYAGMGPDFVEFKERDHEGGYGGMEDLADKSGAGLIIIDSSVKEMESIPDFEHYERVKTFCGEKDIVVIYRRSNNAF